MEGLTGVPAIVLAAAPAPIAADRLTPVIRVPSVVLEILLGVVIGPALLGWVRVDEVVDAISQFGLAVLLFMAGYEIDFRQIRGAPLKSAILGWFASVVLGILLGTLLGGGLTVTAQVIGLALTTTALGTILPMIRDSGALPTPFGARVLAIGALGEFGPIVAIALVFSEDAPLHTLLVVLAFAVIAPGAAFLFAAGIVVRLGMEARDEREERIVAAKLDAVGFGFLIPFFFVVSGVKLDVKSLVAHPASLLLIPLVLVLFLVSRGVPAYLVNRRDEHAVALALFASAALPLVVVITSTGVELGAITPSTAAAMVMAGVLSVLVYPLIALRLYRAKVAERSEPL
ncbi:cation:proton antiporter [Thermoactinospora rubra]|uniref:cation:proton antiporter n=1 Tax=Thermoactinospora rubra TaxID=1088767 RepID=UPI00117C6A5A|nr:cation:proton antiporter [Thermoactinospora rubra]